MNGPSSDYAYSEEDLLPVSALADLIFCERRAALHFLERVWEDNPFTVEGTYLHEKVDALQATEVRGDLRIARGLRLRSVRLGLTGKADVVEFCRLPEGKAGVSFVGVRGLWNPIPVEYKRGRLRHERGYEVQLCAQAISLEEMMNVEVGAGAIYYGKTGRRLGIPFDEKLRRETEGAAERLHELLASEETPRAVQGPKCKSCSLLDLCMPGVTGKRRNIQGYLSKAIAETGEDKL